MGVRKQAGAAAVLESPIQAELAETLDRIRALCERKEGWNGYDVAAPNPAAIATAQRWVKSLHSELIDSGRKWIRPHVSSDEDGNVALEWRNDPRSLTVYIMP